MAVDPPAGPDGGGATVTLSGSDLQGATSVNFWDFGQAQIVRIAPDGTSMEVTTPPAWWGGGPVYVQVTTPLGHGHPGGSVHLPAGAGGAVRVFVGLGRRRADGHDAGGALVNCDSPALTPFDRQADGCP
jgi:hypothetical protein